MKSVFDILPLGLRRFPVWRGRSNLKTTFAEGKERYQRIFGVTPPALVLQCSERVLCAKNAEFDKMQAAGGSAVSYAWWVWRKGWRGQTTLDWINHPAAQYAKQLELF